MGKALLYLFLAMIVVGLMVSVFKMAIIVLILAGLIFRTKETVGFLSIMLILGLIAKFPWAALGVVVALIIWAMIRANKKKSRGEES